MLGREKRITDAFGPDFEDYDYRGMIQLNDVIVKNLLLGIYYCFISSERFITF